jgi:subtilase family serine protease
LIPDHPRTHSPGRHGRLRAAFGRAGIALAASSALVAGGLGFAGAAPAQAAAHAIAARAKAPDYKRACSAKVAAQASCMVLMRTNVKHRAQSDLRAGAGVTGFGYGPSSLQSAYKLTSDSAADGSGKTVAVVDAFDDPRAQADLNTYRKAWGLPACGSGCFKKVNQNGQTSPLPKAAGSTGWDVEESLDFQMVSAICPKCHILLVEASSASITNLGIAVNTAVKLGAVAVSNSYGQNESASDPTYDTKYYKHPGVAVTVSAGDSGYGVGYPAASQYVTSVGGTSLSKSSSSRGWTESVWSGTGSGCSKDDAKPSWQHDTGCKKRTDNDTSAVANPNTGVAIYDSYSQGGWLEVGGTSVSSPIVASVFALAGKPAAGTYPSSYIYQHTSNLFDVTSGSNGSCSPAYLCHAEKGYDGPTGWGTPDGTTAFKS